jgi:hypothetical protein
MKQKKAKLLRRHLAVTARWPQDYRISLSNMFHPMFPAARVVNPIRLVKGHPRAGYRAAKRMYKDRVGLRAFIQSQTQLAA